MRIRSVPWRLAVLVGTAMAAGVGAAAPTLPSATVCPAGCDFTQVQPALDAVVDDGTVIISAGSYDAGLAITRTVTLRGSGSAATVLSGATTTVGTGIDVVISGISLRDAVDTQLVNNGRLTLRDTFVDNAAPATTPSFLTGGAVRNNGGLVATDSTFTGRGRDVGGLDNLGSAVLRRTTIERAQGNVGAVINVGALTLDSSRVIDNVATFTGGIRNDVGASLVVRGGEISRNGGQGAGAIQNGGDAVVTDTLIADNAVSVIWTSGRLTLDRVTIRRWGGGLGFRGAIYNEGSSVVRTTTIEGDPAAQVRPSNRAAIVNEGTMTVNGSVVRNVVGGGVRNAGTLTVRSSRIVRNTSRSNGAGINNEGVLLLHSSTVRRNTSEASGGGLANSGTARLVDSRVTGNTALSGGGIANLGTAVITLVRTLVAGNTPDNCSGC